MKKYYLCLVFVLCAAPAWAQSLRLDWRHEAPNELGFEVERGPAVTGPFAKIGEVGVDVLSYVDRTLTTPTTHYCYRVRAFNLLHTGDPTSRQYSDYSNIACGAAQNPPPPFPVDLRLSQVATALGRVQNKITPTQRTGKIGADLKLSQQKIKEVRAALRPTPATLEEKE